MAPGRWHKFHAPSLPSVAHKLLITFMHVLQDIKGLFIMSWITDEWGFTLKYVCVCTCMCETACLAVLMGIVNYSILDEGFGCLILHMRLLWALVLSPRRFASCDS